MFYYHQLEVSYYYQLVTIHTLSTTACHSLNMSTTTKIIIKGVIHSIMKAVKLPTGKWAPKRFVVVDSNGSAITCVCNAFCDPIIQDRIVAAVEKGEYDRQTVFFINTPPCVMPGTNQLAVTRAIERCMEQADRELHGWNVGNSSGSMTQRCELVYKAIISHLRSRSDNKIEAQDVINYLDDCSEENREIEGPINDSRAFNAQWKKVNILRRLYALGLNNMDISTYGGSPSQLYRDIMITPYKVLTLSLEKCAHITKMMGEEINPKYVRCGMIIRDIHKQNKDGGHMYLTLKMIKSTYQDFDWVKDDLHNIFDVVYVVNEYANISTTTIENDPCADEDSDYEDDDADNQLPPEILAILRAAEAKQAEADKAKAILAPTPTYDRYSYKSILCRSKAGMIAKEEIKPNELSPSIPDSDINVYLWSIYKTELTISEYPILMKNLPPIELIHHRTYSRDDLSEDQVGAVQMAFDNRLCIITGGAGTGKTTIAKELLYNNNQDQLVTAMVAFTGKAASRLRIVVKYPQASTVHRYLSQGSDPYHLIIDEASMLTSELFCQLLTKFPSVQRVTLIGDDNQLLPIEAGAFFHHYVESGVIPTYRLKVNHRFRVRGNVNGIVHNANLIANATRGTAVKLERCNNFITMQSITADISPIIEAFEKSNNNPGNKYKITTRDFTIICPVVSELPRLNAYIQDKFRTGDHLILSPKLKVCVEDRVMMTANHYDFNVFNGEEGYVKELHPVDNYMVVDFTQPGAEIPNNIKIFKDEEARVRWVRMSEGREDGIVCDVVELSYANTVHKYQGSESEYVIVVLPYHGNSSATSFMCRNLLYTAITRGKTCVYVVGDLELMNNMASYWPMHGRDLTGIRLRTVLPQLNAAA